MIVYSKVTPKEVTNLCKNGKLEESSGNIKFYEYSFLSDLMNKGQYGRNYKNSNMFLICDIPEEVLQNYQSYVFCDARDLQINYLSCIPVPEYNLPKSLFRTSDIIEVNSVISIEYNNDMEFQKYLLLFEKAYRLFCNLDDVVAFFNANSKDKLIQIMEDLNNQQLKRA